jgi:hypothetical protein
MAEGVFERSGFVIAPFDRITDLHRKDALLRALVAVRQIGAIRD